MNSKWIVPVVAMILCAVSLIGAGYAAYSATLSDSETATLDQNYVKLTEGTGYVAASQVDVYWDYSIAVVNGTPADPVYRPYLDVETTDSVVKYGEIFKLSVGKDITHLGDEVTDSDSYTLTVSSHTCSTLSGTTIAVFTDSALTNAADLDELDYDTVYYVALGYTHDEADNIDDGTVPDDSATVTVSLLATANLVTKS